MQKTRLICLFIVLLIGLVIPLQAQDVSTSITINQVIELVKTQYPDLYIIELSLRDDLSTSCWLVQLFDDATDNISTICVDLSTGDISTLDLLGDTSSNTSTNTSNNTSSNTSTNTSNNTSSNTSTNTSNNTSSNTSTNTSNNTSSNTSTNTSNNTSSNTSTNTSNNTSSNTSTNTSTNDDVTAIEINIQLVNITINSALDNAIRIYPKGFAREITLHFESDDFVLWVVKFEESKKVEISAITGNILYYGYWDGDDDISASNNVWTGQSTNVTISGQSPQSSSERQRNRDDDDDDDDD